MRLGLFGKILIAFWATLIVLGIFLALVFASTPYEDRPAVRLAPSILLLLSRTLERDGAVAAERDRLLLEGGMRDRITISRAATTSISSQKFAAIRRAIGPDGHAYVLAYDRERPRKLSRVSKKSLWGGAAAGLVFSVALGWYMGQPIRLLRNGFHRLAQGDLAVRLGPSVARRNDEIADLARDFDVMAERLGQLVTARDRLLNDVSHELRSPLTRLQLAVGLARQDRERHAASLDRIEQETAKLDSLVDELLTLARAESGAEGGDYFDPSAMIARALKDAELEAGAKSVRLFFAPMDGPEDCRPAMAGSAALFQRAIENIVRNAIRFSPESAAIHVITELSPGPPQRYRILVLDKGPGVAPELLDQLFEPFVRADPSGTGLGLAIAQRAIAAHGGMITCSNRPGGGFVVEVEIPVTMLSD